MKLGEYIEIDHIIHNLGSEKVMIRDSDWRCFPSMLPTLEPLIDVSKTDCSILLTGETGSGKSYFAKKIHHISNRAHSPFIELNSSAIPEPLFESQFFGHCEGAFTDAKAPHKGYLSMANHGTIFMDEIADLPLNLQSKLLTVLDQTDFWPVGASEPTTCNIRFIFATNTDLLKKVREGSFREDLYFRIACFPVNILPIRSRGNEAIYLFFKFFQEYTQAYAKKVVGISLGAYKNLSEFTWPGNIRQIKFCAQRTAILVKNEWISQSDLTLPVDHYDTVESNFNIDSLLRLSLPDAVKTLEKRIIQIRLEKHRNISRAARECEISRQTFKSKCRLYELPI